MSYPRRDQQFLDILTRKLKALREDKGLSQMRVLMDTGVNVSRIESGKRMPSVYSIAILCKYYDITLDRFFQGLDLKNTPWE